MLCFRKGQKNIFAIFTQPLSANLNPIQSLDQHEQQQVSGQGIFLPSFLPPRSKWRGGLWSVLCIPDSPFILLHFEEAGSDV